MRWKTSRRSSVLINYAYANVEQMGKDIGNYPQHQTYLRHDWMFVNNWYLNTQLHWVGERGVTPDFGTEQPADIDDYQQVDLTMRYKDIRGGKINFAFGVKNVFNEIGREPVLNAPLAGRSYFGEFRYRF